ncbi:hypothetical protein SKAU_G00015150 [Synaphobranchus kaupii]|uniref:Uncharacterized protein n=1 Tax=Synaphobranchus kaupii TaxID=118154 RepID=A0A9Q1GB30_SYNKA|nr:hypothetical protein SKAU_G00015150 [Synaphobranchus kaupii]
MGLIFSWFKGSTEQQALQDVTVETQVKIEDAVVNKTVPKEKNNDSPLVVPHVQLSLIPALLSVLLSNKPLSNDDALESLSAGFTNSAPQCPAGRAGSINDVSLPVTQSIPDKPGSVPLDALGALSDTLAAPEPEPEPPKIDPKDVVNEGTVGTEMRSSWGREKTPSHQNTGSQRTGQTSSLQKMRSPTWTLERPWTSCQVISPPCQQHPSNSLAWRLLTSMLAPDFTTDLGFELVPDSTPDLASDSTPELGSDSSPELASDSSPEPEPVAVKDRIQV